VTTPELGPVTDGLIIVRPAAPGDARVLAAGRDEASRRWLGPGAAVPPPAGCVVAGDEIVGWVDYDSDRDWLRPGEVNVGYNVFAAHRGRGYASRAVQLLMHHLAVFTRERTATLLIHPANERSLAVAARTRFAASGQVNGDRYFKRPVPPLEYTDVVLTIRRGVPGDGFGTGPRWTFAVDARDATSVARVGCDLAGELAPPGEALIWYSSSHPAHRAWESVSRAVRLVIQFLQDHTGARQAHLIADVENVVSPRVAQALGATAIEQWVDDRGRTLVRYVVSLGLVPGVPSRLAGGGRP
jgi:RimJ/RimL family protein N-acetyltransferase